MIIRQQAFTGGNDKFLKGGLHCHTTRSDGQLPPEEVIRLHAENGYDFLALTDHRFYNYTNFAPETNVLIVPGMETCSRGQPAKADAYIETGLALPKSTLASPSQWLKA